MNLLCNGLHPPLYSSTTDKSRAGFVSETRMVAEFLLPRVLSSIKDAPRPITLAEAASTCGTAAMAEFAARGLKNIKAITSGSPGGLGKKKKARKSRSVDDVASGNSVAEAAAGDADGVEADGDAVAAQAPSP